MNKGQVLIDRVEDLQAFIDATIQISDCKIEEISLDSQNEWGIVDGVLTHQNKGFFQVVAYKNEGYESLVLYQPQGAFNGMLICKNDGDIFVLIQARIEPGNTGICQYGPTIQSTPANYLRLHKGKETPYLEYFFQYKGDAHLLWNSTQIDLGKQYFQKTKKLNYILIDSLIPTAENMVWVKLETLFEAVHFDHFLNTDLRSMLGLFDWNSLKEPKISNHFSEENLQIPHAHNTHFEGKILPLTELKNWTISNKGILPINEKLPFVKLYKTSCTNREVGEWVQPLMGTTQNPHFVQYVRNSGDDIELLLSNTETIGQPYNSILMPSLELENKELALPENANVMYQIDLSEEGGRFMQNVSTYSICIVPADISIEENQFWVSKKDFRQILKTSNLMGIQLRCIASLLIKELN